jgi:hypothetical protein
LVAVIPGLENAEDFTRLLALGEGKIVFGYFRKLFCDVYKRD